MVKAILSRKDRLYQHGFIVHDDGGNVNFSRLKMRNAAEKPAAKREYGSERRFARRSGFRRGHFRRNDCRFGRRRFGRRGRWFRGRRFGRRGRRFGGRGFGRRSRRFRRRGFGRRGRRFRGRRFRRRGRRFRGRGFGRRGRRFGGRGFGWRNCRFGGRGFRRFNCRRFGGEIDNDGRRPHMAKRRKQGDFVGRRMVQVNPAGVERQVVMIHSVRHGNGARRIQIPTDEAIAFACAGIGARNPCAAQR